MKKEKKPWEKPQLIILARGNAEESVLVHCKSNGLNQSLGPEQADVQDCAYQVTSCAACQARASSTS